MPDDKDIPQNTNLKVLPFGTFDFGGKGPGTYLGGSIKISSDQEEDLLASAESFLKAADRCLNSCKDSPGIEILTVPGAVCASLSCELFLKYIILIETGKNFKKHELIHLFRLCSAEVRDALTKRRSDIHAIFESNNTYFVDARYHHEESQFCFRQQELLQTAELLSGFVRDEFRKAAR